MTKIQERYVYFRSIKGYRLYSHRSRAVSQDWDRTPVPAKGT